MSLADMFQTQLNVVENVDLLELEMVENQLNTAMDLTLLVKPLGFRIPSPNIIISHLMKVWKARKGLKIFLHKVKKDILICCFKDREEMDFVEN